MEGITQSMTSFELPGIGLGLASSSSSSMDNVASQVDVNNQASAYEAIPYSNSRGREIDETDDTGFQTVVKKSKKAKVGEDSMIFSDQEQMMETKNRVILIKFTAPGAKYTNPLVIERELHRSEFQKYVLPCCIKILGKGSACRIEIRDPHNRITSHLGQIKKIGDIDVKCWCATDTDATHYGKIDPVSLDFSEDELLSKLVAKGETDCNIVSVRRMKNQKSEHIDVVLLGFQGCLPEIVELGNGYYDVVPYTRPPLRCFKCHLFNHGTLTCKSPNRRCIRCGVFHENLENCDKDFFCIFCKGNHKYTSKICTVNTKAWEIERKKNEKEISATEAKELFMNLNKCVKSSESQTDVGRSNANYLNQGARPKVNSAKVFPSLPSASKLQVALPPDGDEIYNETTDSDVDLFSDVLKGDKVKRNRKEKQKKKPNRERKQIPSPPKEFNRPNPFGKIKSIFAYRNEKGDENDDEDTGLFDLIMSLASEFFEIYYNGKSVYENLMDYCNIAFKFAEILFRWNSQ